MIATLLVAALVWGLDILSKQLVMARLVEGQSVSVIPNLFYLSYTRNPGAAYGILSGSRWLLALIALVAVGFFIYGSRRMQRGAERVALGLLIGGALGNLLDRIRWGLVTDFLEIRPLRSIFQVFNVADLAISSAVVLAVVLALFVRENRSAAEQK